MIKIEELKNVKFAKDIDGLEIKLHVPITTKEAMINGIVDILVKEDEKGMYTYDSIKLEVLKTVAIVSLFTNIELSEDDYVNYDIITNLRLVEYIDGSMFDVYECTSEMWEFSEMLTARIDDKLRENTIEHAVAKGVQDIVKIIDNTMDHVNGMLDKGDPNKIAKYLSKGIEVIANKLPDLSKLNVVEELAKGKNFN